ncbi:MAG: hypothetical protein WC460_01255 [Patescibacteria group bacterium]
MSHSATIYTLIAALLKSEDLLGKGREWLAQNPDQEKLIRKFLEHSKEITKIKEIESIASLDAKMINEFLKKRGFSIRLPEFKTQEFGVAAVLDLMVEWILKGKRIQIQGQNGAKYPGIHLQEEVSFFNAYDRAEPIAKISTASDDAVYLTMANDVPTGLELIGYASKLISQLRYNPGYEGLQFPMVDFTNQPDLSWLIGMSTTDSNGNPAVISQALQETKLRLNENGARVQDAAAMTLIRACVTIPKKKLIINRPFLCIFTQTGLKLPLAVFHLEPDCWKDPGGLE